MNLSLSNPKTDDSDKGVPEEVFNADMTWNDSPSLGLRTTPDLDARPRISFHISRRRGKMIEPLSTGGPEQAAILSIGPVGRNGIGRAS